MSLRKLSTRRFPIGQCLFLVATAHNLDGKCNLWGMRKGDD